MMSETKQSILVCYNRKTFIIEILNVTTRPHCSLKVVQGEGTKRDKRQKKKGKESGKMIISSLSWAVFCLPNSFFQEVKSNQKSFSCPVMYFTLILCWKGDRTHDRK